MWGLNPPNSRGFHTRLSALRHSNRSLPRATHNNPIVPISSLFPYCYTTIFVASSTNSARVLAWLMLMSHTVICRTHVRDCEHSRWSEVGEIVQIINTGDRWEWAKTNERRVAGSNISRTCHLSAHRIQDSDCTTAYRDCRKWGAVWEGRWHGSLQRRKRSWSRINSWNIDSVRWGNTLNTDKSCFV